MAWNGPHELTRANVDRLKEEPGAYIIGHVTDGEEYGRYVGRSDSDLRGRIRDHLPENETDPCIQKGNSHFWYQYANSAEEAYEIECGTYHNQGDGYTCNEAHPAKSDPSWTCPETNCPE